MGCRCCNIPLVGRSGERYNSLPCCSRELELIRTYDSHLSFNPIAPTIMKKALNRILDEVHSSSSSSITGTRPSPSTLDVIIQNSNGDIRSALMSLQFLATQGGSVTSTDIGGKVKGKKKAKGGDAKEMLQIVTSRENSLFIFHALGKVLYNKRELLCSASVMPECRVLTEDLNLQDGENPPRTTRRT